MAEILLIVLTALLVVANMGLVWVTTGLLRATKNAAEAAVLNAKTARQEFELRATPLLAVDWKAPRVNGDWLAVEGAIREVGGFPTALHSARVWKSVIRTEDPCQESPPEPVGNETTASMRDVILHGTEYTHAFYCRLPISAFGNLEQRAADGAPVAAINVAVTVSPAISDATKQDWEFSGFVQVVSPRPKSRFAMLSIAPHSV